MNEQLRDILDELERLRKLGYTIIDPYFQSLVEKRNSIVDEKIRKGQEVLKKWGTNDDSNEY